jgi:hypothetical protein
MIGDYQCIKRTEVSLTAIRDLGDCLIVAFVVTCGNSAQGKQEQWAKMKQLHS